MVRKPLRAFENLWQLLRASIRISGSLWALPALQPASQGSGSLVDASRASATDFSTPELPPRGFSQICSQPQISLPPNCRPSALHCSFAKIWTPRGPPPPISPQRSIQLCTDLEASVKPQKSPPPISLPLNCRPCALDNFVDVLRASGTNFSGCLEGLRHQFLYP